MSLKYLSGELDIHCGGIDHINIHHTNEIAQSEAATGQRFFNYWMHGAFLNMNNGEKMAKSTGNFLTLDLASTAKNINPLSYRFANLQTHYRKPMEYSEHGLEQAEKGLNSLLKQVAVLGELVGKINEEYKNKFLEIINNDLNLPQALALIAKLLKSKISNPDKLATILDYDKVLGLNLNLASGILKRETNLTDLPLEVQKLIKGRAAARLAKNWLEADRLRIEINNSGYDLEDTLAGIKIILLKK